jgi:hypothetical protein
MSHRDTLATLLVALLLVTAGCSTGSDSGAPQAGGDTGAEATDGGGGSQGATDGAGAGTSGEGSEATPAVGDRKLVRTAKLTMEVESFQSTRSNLTATVRQFGGYVGDASMETTEYDNETYTEGTLVLRVPVENYSTFLAAVEGEGTVLRADESVDDVTREYVDLQARLENLRAQRDRLRGLYERANDTEEVLAVEERLSAVQGEIERTEARLRTLQNQVSLATITVTLREERPPREPPERTQWYDTGLVEAFLDSVSGVVTTLRAVAVAVAYALPYLLVFGLPLVALVVLLRRAGRPSLPSLRNRGGSE